MDKVSTPHGPVSLLVDGSKPHETLIVLGHGAGADLSSDFMAAMASGLTDEGISVGRFNFAYIEQGKKGPDPQPRLEETFAAVVDHVVRTARPERLFLGGKSMGGRIASHVAATMSDVRGLVFFGYPLHPPGRPDRIRDAHLKGLSVPMLFIEGTRDPFCPLDTLDGVRKTLPARTDVVVIDDGDHSFKVRKSSGRGTPDAWREVVHATAEWMREIA